MHAQPHTDTHTDTHRHTHSSSSSSSGNLMPLQDGDSVALERRMDLASLFCLIGRHGPAVVLVLIAMVSVLAAVILYRTVRGKTRRKAGDRDGDRDGEQELNPGDPRRSSVEATDVSDEVSSEMKDDADPFQRDLKLRHRRAPAAENKPSTYSPAETYTEATHNLKCDATTVAETKVKSATDDGVREEEVLEEVHVNGGCWKEPVLIRYERHEEVEKEFEAEDQDDGSVTTDDIEDDSCCCICYGKDELEEENHLRDSIDDSNHSSYPLSPEEEQENEGEEAEEEFVEQQLVPQREEICPSTCEQEPSSQQDCQQPQSEEKQDEISKPLDKDTGLTDPGSDAPSLQEELHHKINQRSADDTFTVKGEEMSCPHFSFVCQHQTSDHKEVNETLVEAEIPATDAAVCDNDTSISSGMSEEISPPDTLALTQDQESDQMQNNGMSPDLDPLMWQPPLPSLKRSELRDQDEGSMCSAAVEAESGISSMAVSPDLQDAGHDFAETVENMVVPQLDWDSPSEEGKEAKNNLYADDADVSVIKDETAGLVFGPYPSRVSQQPHSEHTGEDKFASFADNEDTFGHEIEDSYHTAHEQLMLQISANVISTTDELRNEHMNIDEKVFVEVVEKKEKKEDVRSAKKMETEAETEKEDDYEKTEISIMEATMDNNEWITDSNQVLPWMNITVPSFCRDHKTTDQPPADDRRPGSSLTDVSRVDTEPPPSTEDKQTSALSAVDDNTEINKKVVAVHPMPQNVDVTFSLHYLTRSPYQTVGVTGNQQELGNWKEFVPLERAKDGHWATLVSLPAESHVEWKFVLVEKGEVCRWEECGNRLLDTGSGDELTVHKWWGLL
ncbi:uncharacterized protein stbd1 [Limanda limanda]|uniref:uncharacterized protein stbd1 n=1 Tax=Limanda limanda TaxID=27771 RepID=UPI0029C94472|nr:uncharacterized protein stbd1 [Limanda limanda]